MRRGSREPRDKAASRQPRSTNWYTTLKHKKAATPKNRSSLLRQLQMQEEAVQRKISDLSAKQQLRQRLRDDLLAQRRVGQLELGEADLGRQVLCHRAHSIE
jgi:hypothetical protein